MLGLPTWISLVLCPVQSECDVIAIDSNTWSRRFIDASSTKLGNPHKQAWTDVLQRLIIGKLLLLAIDLVSEVAAIIHFDIVPIAFKLAVVPAKIISPVQIDPRLVRSMNEQIRERDDDFIHVVVAIACDRYPRIRRGDAS